MLFNSYEFIFLFLPLTFAGYFLLRRISWDVMSKGWLVSDRKLKFLEFIKMHTSFQALDESYKCIKTNISDPGGTGVLYHYNRSG